MKIDIMFLVNHFGKVGEVFFCYSLFLYNKKRQDDGDKCACDARTHTLYEMRLVTSFKWLQLAGEFLKKLEV